MQIHLTPDQEAFIQQRVHAGRFRSADEALQEAVSLLEQRENRQPLFSERKSLARLFAESPFKGLDLDFPREKDELRYADL